MPSGDFYIGLMSGTSMDAIDTVLVDFEHPQPKIEAYKEFPIDSEIKSRIRAIDANTSIAKVTEADAIMGKLFADAAMEILSLSSIDPKEVAAIGSHGQTVLHLPDDPHPRTMQIGDPNIITCKTGIKTITDFRRMDLACGGQGAPLAPAFHEYIFRDAKTTRAILNIGGVANLSILPCSPELDIFGFDTGPGNGLLDDWNQKHNNTEMDRNSIWASTGTTDSELLTRFMSEPYFSAPPPKSTGRDYLNLGWVEDHLIALGKTLNPTDVQSTLLDFTVHTIADAVDKHAPEVKEIYLCGGGSHNMGMIKRLKTQLPNQDIKDTNKLGLDPDAIEALTFAWLARQTCLSLAGNNPCVTGADSMQILGGIYQAL